MKCKLCHFDKKLCLSHIVPSSIIDFVRDETMNNRFYKVGGKANEIVQDGPKEYLLCDECEQKIGCYEKYYKEAIHLSRHGVEIIQNSRVVILKKLDYKKVKLFLLSILWRMSISTLPHFSNVSLGCDEEVLRKILIEENPGNNQKYPITAIVPLIEEKMNEAWMCFPIVGDHSDGTVHYMIIGGILYSISMTQHNSCFDKYLLHESGDWAMPLIDFYKIPFLKAIVDENFG